jgi:flagellin
MSMSIRTNVASLDAQRNLSQTQLSLESSLSKLSSGYRITKAGDDAAGLALSNSLTAQYRSYNQAIRNGNDGLSVVQSAEAGYNEIGNILTRMRELAMQASSDTVTDSQRSAYIDTERTQLSSEIDRIAASTKFNGVSLIDGTATSQLDFQVGIGSNASGNDAVSLDVTALNATTTGLSINSLKLDTKANALSALDSIDAAIDTLATQRATLGAVGNRLQSAINATQTFAQATASANSRIRDVDVAEETANMTRANILAQAGVSVLAQANQMPQMALKLLG